jgi:N-acetylglutamate synthase-like GNAT family acetyltransferase
MELSVATLVRRATESDAEALARLRFEFRAPRAPNVESEQEFLARCSGWMRARLSTDSVWRAWLVERNSELVGSVWLQVVEKLPNPTVESERHAYVSNFYVRPDHRGSGIGSTLLTRALAEAGRLQVDSVFLWPSERSRPLYERFGFETTNDVLVLKR